MCLMEMSSKMIKERENVVVQMSCSIMYGKWNGNAAKCRRWKFFFLVVVTDMEENYGIVEMSAFVFV